MHEKKTRYVFIVIFSKTKKSRMTSYFLFCLLLEEVFHENKLETKNPQNLISLPESATATSPCHLRSIQLQIREQGIPIRGQLHPLLEQLCSCTTYWSTIHHSSRQSTEMSVSARALLYTSTIQVADGGAGHACSTTATSTDTASFAVA